MEMKNLMKEEQEDLRIVEYLDMHKLPEKYLYSRCL